MPTLLGIALLLAAPLAIPAAEPLALLAWLTLLAAPAGAWLAASVDARIGRAGSGQSRVALGGLLLFVAWLSWVAVETAGAASGGSVGRGGRGAPGAPVAFASTFAALLGLAAAGRALSPGPAAPLERRVSRAVFLLVLGALLSSLASLGGLWRGVPWPPEVAARLLDLSPVTLTAESAGVDWMRHSFVYEAAGTASIGPELRSAWGSLAGPVCFVVGCALVFAVRLRERRARGLETPPSDR